MTILTAMLDRLGGGVRSSGRTPGIPIRLGEHDPRLSGPQRKAIEALSVSDPEARILGLDEQYRPVVLATLGHPPALTEYAILRNGDPARPSLMGDDTLREEWWEDGT